MGQEGRDLRDLLVRAASLCRAELLGAAAPAGRLHPGAEQGWRGPDDEPPTFCCTREVVALSRRIVQVRLGVSLVALSHRIVQVRVGVSLKPAAR